MIELQRVGKRLGGRRVLEQIDARIPSRHICALLGPNGAGKTTLLRCLTGALRPDAGRCLIGGADSSGLGDVSSRFAFLPDHPPLEDELRVREYLLLHARLRAVPRPHAPRIAEVLRAVDLEEAPARLVGTLSRGQRARLALAECLLHRPEVLLLDEPTAGLDPAQVVALRALLGRLRERCCILLATHNLGEAAAVCDSVLVLAAGRVRFQGALQELAARADGDLEAAYLATVAA